MFSPKVNVQVFTLGLLLFIGTKAYAQKYSKLVSVATTEIQDDQFTGYKTFFDFPPKEVYRGFWRYCKEFARPINKKQYYEVTIPSSVNGGDIDVVFYGKAESGEKNCEFVVALKKEGLPSDQISTYDQQIRKILQDFKSEFYLERIDKSIKLKIKDLGQLSKLYERNLSRNEPEAERDKLLQEIKSIESELETLQQKKLSISK